MKNQQIIKLNKYIKILFYTGISILTFELLHDIIYPNIKTEYTMLIKPLIYLIINYAINPILYCINLFISCVCINKIKSNKFNQAIILSIIEILLTSSEIYMLCYATITILIVSLQNEYYKENIEE